MDYDPWESFNEKTFSFNFDDVDHYAIKPAAKVWAKALPEPVRQSLGNAFYNLAMPKRFVNKVLQGRLPGAGVELARFVVNTTVGIGGLFNYTYAIWNQMKAQGGGHIIGIASGSSIRGYKEEIAYCTIKHGIEGFVKALSLEAKPHNIALNTIGPGIRIKPTRITWAEYDQAPAELRATWADPVELGKAWVWLAAQPPGRFSGCRFDAANLVQTIAREGYDFEFAAEKVTLYPDDFRARQERYRSYSD